MLICGAFRLFQRIGLLLKKSVLRVAKCIDIFALHLPENQLKKHHFGFANPSRSNCSDFSTCREKFFTHYGIPMTNMTWIGEMAAEINAINGEDCIMIKLTNKGIEIQDEKCSRGGLSVCEFDCGQSIVHDTNIYAPLNSERSKASSLFFFAAPFADKCSNGNIPPSNFVEIFGDFYELSSLAGLENFYEAESRCEAMGSHLPVFKTKLQYMALESLISKFLAQL